MRRFLVAGILLMSLSSIAQSQQGAAAEADSQASPIPVASPTPPSAPVAEVPPPVAVDRRGVPEYFYQPIDNETAFTFFVGTGSDRATAYTKPGTRFADVSVAETQYELRAHHNFGDDFSAQLAVAYATTETNLSPTSGPQVGSKATGFGDVELDFQKILMSSRSGFVIGLQLTGSPGKARAATPTSEGNQLSGGWAVAPAIGYYRAVKTNTTLGASLKYIVRMERVEDNNSSPSFDHTYSGGNRLIFDVFAQQKMKKLSAELSLGLIAADSVEDRANSNPPVTTKADAYTAIRAIGALHFYVEDDVTLSILGRIVASPERSQSTTIKLGSDTETAIGARARFTFD